MKGSLARRYARALVEIAKEEGLVEKFGEELMALDAVTRQSPQILITLSNEWVDFNDRLRATEEVARAVGLHPHLKNFLLLLIKKERLNYFHDIVREYGRFTDVLLNILRVTVATPKAPGADILQRVEKILSQGLKKRAMAQGETRPEMIGGIIVKLDNTIYDGSVRRSLERIKENLMKG